jgi:hypothetical protein
VPNFNMVTRIHVLTAIRDYDEKGAATFLSEQGVEGRPEQLLVERGRRYDPRGLLVFAYRKATGTQLAVDELPADLAAVLTRLDFKVVSQEDQAKPAAKKAPRASRAKPAPAAPAKPEPVIALCPSCFTQLPASGRCDYCD